MKFLQNLLLNIAILSLIFAPVAFASNTYHGAAWVWGAEATYDGAFTLGTFLHMSRTVAKTND